MENPVRVRIMELLRSILSFLGRRLRISRLRPFLRYAAVESSTNGSLTDPFSARVHACSRSERSGNGSAIAVSGGNQGTTDSLRKYICVDPGWFGHFGVVRCR